MLTGTADDYERLAHDLVLAHDSQDPAAWDHRRGRRQPGACEQLERVNLMGSPTGDGAIAALQGKPALHYFSSGRLVTDAGLRMLHNFPRLQAWHGGEAGGSHLLIDGPFTDDGLASLAGLDGVFELDLFWHVTGITPAGFAHLVNSPTSAAASGWNARRACIAATQPTPPPRTSPGCRSGTTTRG